MKREGGEPLPSLLCGFDGPLLTPLNTFSSRVRHNGARGGGWVEGGLWGCKGRGASRKSKAVYKESEERQGLETTT